MGFRPWLLSAIHETGRIIAAFQSQRETRCLRVHSEMMVDDENTAAAVVRTPGRPLVSRAAVLRLVVGLLLAAAILVVVARVADDAPGALDVLSDASWPWVGAAVGAQLICYACLGVQLDRLIGGRSERARLVPIRLALLVYGLGTVLPGAPAPGMVLATADLGRHGVGAGQSAMAFFLSIWFNVRTFLVLVVLTAVTATVRGRVPNNSRALVIAS